MCWWGHPCSQTPSDTQDERQGETDATARRAPRCTPEGRYVIEDVVRGLPENE